MDVIGKFENAKKIMEECENSQLILQSRKQHLKLAPKFIGNYRAGVHQQLSALLSNPDKVLDGFPLAYNNVCVLQKAGKMISDQTCVHLNIKADFIMFKPVVGCRLNGKVNKIAKRHIGCLVHDHFNAWMPHTSSTEKIATDRLMNAEVEFTVQEISTNRNVLSIKGKFEKFLSPSLQKNNMVMISTEEPKTPRKKKKKDNTTNVDIDTTTEEITAESVSPSTKKKKKHRKEVTEVSQDVTSDSQRELENSITNVSVDTTIEEITAEDISPSTKRKKKHRKGVTEVSQDVTSDSQRELENSITDASVDTTTEEITVEGISLSTKKKKKHRKGVTEVSRDMTSDSQRELENSITENNDVDEDQYLKLKKKHKKDKRKSREGNETVVGGAGNVNDSLASVASCEPLFSSTQIDDISNNEEQASDKKHKKKKKKHTEILEIDGSNVRYVNSCENENVVTTDADEGRSLKLIEDSSIIQETPKNRKRRHDDNKFTKLKDSMHNDLDLAVPSPFKKLKKQKKLVIDLDFDSSADFEESSKPGKKEKKKKKHKDKSN